MTHLNTLLIRLRTEILKGDQQSSAAITEALQAVLNTALEQSIPLHDLKVVRKGTPYPLAHLFVQFTPERDAITFLEHIVRAGGHLQALDRGGDSALRQAIFKSTEKDDSLVRYLLEHGADVNAYDQEHRTPLLQALRYGQMHLAPLLLEHGADPALCGHHEVNAFHQLAATGTPEVIELCLKQLKTQSAQKHLESPDITAEEQFMTLLDQKDQHGRSALYYAVNHGQVETIKRLTLQGATIHQTGREGHDSPFLAACGSQSESEAFEIVHFFKEHYSEIFTPDLIQDSFHIACQRQDLLALFFVDLGADIHYFHPSHGYGTHLAMKHSNAPLLRHLFSKGIDINRVIAEEDGSAYFNTTSGSLLHLAFDEHLEDMAHFLIEEMHIDLDLKNKDGLTVLDRVNLGDQAEAHSFFSMFGVSVPASFSEYIRDVYKARDEHRALLEVVSPTPERNAEKSLPSSAQASDQQKHDSLPGSEISEGSAFTKSRPVRRSL